MAVCYTQILSKETRKILAGEYSAAGTPLKPDRTLLLELKQAVSVVPAAAGADDGKIYNSSMKRSNYAMYFKVKNGLLVCAIADKYATVKEISKYFDDLLREYTAQYADSSTAHYEFDDRIRRVSDDFNKHSKVARGVEELEDAHHMLVENLDTLINRGESINNLKDLADKVNLETREMSRKVSQIKRNAQIEQYKVYAVVALVLIFIFYIFFIK